MDSAVPLDCEECSREDNHCSGQDQEKPFTEFILPQRRNPDAKEHQGSTDVSLRQHPSSCQCAVAEIDTGC